MADNINVKTESGISARAVATDEIGGQHYQRVKAGWGADGTWNETDDTDTKRVPVGGAVLGLPSDAAASSDSASTGLISLVKRLLGKLTSLVNANSGAATTGGNSTGAILGVQAGRRWVGFFAKETSGTAGGAIKLYHNTSAAGTVLLDMTLASNESSRDWFDGGGIDCSGGMWLVVTGSVFIGVYVRIEP